MVRTTSLGGVGGGDGTLISAGLRPSPHRSRRLSIEVISSRRGADRSSSGVGFSEGWLIIVQLGEGRSEIERITMVDVLQLVPLAVSGHRRVQPRSSRSQLHSVRSGLVPVSKMSSREPTTLRIRRRAESIVRFLRQALLDGLADITSIDRKPCPRSGRTEGTSQRFESSVAARQRPRSRVVASGKPSSWSLPPG